MLSKEYSSEYDSVARNVMESHVSCVSSNNSAVAAPTSQSVHVPPEIELPCTISSWYTAAYALLVEKFFAIAVNAVDHGSRSVFDVGANVAFASRIVGIEVGAAVGRLDGSPEGRLLGFDDGVEVGSEVGCSEGCCVGYELGCEDGSSEGCDEGLPSGCTVG